MVERKCENGEISFFLERQKWSDEQNDEGVKVDCSTRPVQSFERLVSERELCIKFSDLL